MEVSNYSANKSLHDKSLWQVDDFVFEELRLYSIWPEAKSVAESEYRCIFNVIIFWRSITLEVSEEKVKVKCLVS